MTCSLLRWYYSHGLSLTRQFTSKLGLRKTSSSPGLEEVLKVGGGSRAMPDRDHIPL